MKIHNFCKVLIFIIISLSWVYPFHYAPWGVAENEFLIFVLPFILLYPLLKKEKIEINGSVIFILLILLVSFLQLFIIDYIFIEDFFLVSLYCFFIILISLISVNYNNKNNIYFALKCLILLCVINTIVMFFQIFEFSSIFIYENLYKNRFSGNIAQPNHLSSLLLTGIVSLLILYRNKIIGIKTLYFLSAYFTIFIFFSGSRAGILTIFLFLIFNFFFFKKEKISFNIVFFSYLILIYLLISYLFRSMARNTIQNIEAASSDSRLDLWSDGINSLISSPWFGYGINGVRTSKLFSSQNFGYTYVSSHNIFLDFILWFGLFVGLFFSIYLLFLIYKIYVSENYSFEKIFFLIPIFVHSLLEYPFRYSYFLFLIMPVLLSKVGRDNYYIGKWVFLNIIGVYIILLIGITFEFEKYSQGAFFSQSQKCEAEVFSKPIFLDLMYNYSKLYCNSLLRSEREKVIYRYNYNMHMKYYLQGGGSNKYFEKAVNKGGE